MDNNSLTILIYMAIWFSMGAIPVLLDMLKEYRNGYKFDYWETSVYVFSMGLLGVIIIALYVIKSLIYIYQEKTYKYYALNKEL
jgi:hypothetical protein